LIFYRKAILWFGIGNAKPVRKSRNEDFLTG